MALSRDVLELETRSLSGEPTLSKAYEILNDFWQNGNRDRELGLHLMFISWYGIVEPAHLTAFQNNAETARELNNSLAAVHAAFEPKIDNDPEMLYAFGLAANMFCFMFENPKEWERISIEYRRRYRELEPDGIDVSIFSNRGAYGAYYAGQAVIKNGY